MEGRFGLAAEEGNGKERKRRKKVRGKEAEG